MTDVHHFGFYSLTISTKVFVLCCVAGVISLWLLISAIRQIYTSYMMKDGKKGILTKIVSGILLSYFSFGIIDASQFKDFELFNFNIRIVLFGIGVVLYLIKLFFELAIDIFDDRKDDEK